MDTNQAPHFSPDGNRFFAKAGMDRITMGPGGTPVTDWTGIAVQVDPTEIEVGSFVWQGAGMFTRVIEAPRPWRKFTQIKVWDEGRGNTSPFRVMRFVPGARPWVVPAPAAD